MGRPGNKAGVQHVLLLWVVFFFPFATNDQNIECLTHFGEIGQHGAAFRGLDGIFHVLDALSEGDVLPSSVAAPNAVKTDHGQVRERDQEKEEHDSPPELIRPAPASDGCQHASGLVAEAHHLPLTLRALPVAAIYTIATSRPGIAYRRDWTEAVTEHGAHLGTA
eukprot:3856196-Rhodomonas_salina.2